MASEHVFYCRQCAAVNGGPVVDLKPGRNTIALKGLCGNCGFVWMDRDGGCCDAQCQIHNPPNTTEAGQVRVASPPAPSRDSERPGDEPVAVGASPAGRFYWPCEEYSTPAENHCWHVPPSPNADFRCIRRDGHPGQHHYGHSPTIRPWSHKDIEPDGWVPIVKCPTDGGVYMMRLPDGTEYVGRWGVQEQRWLRRAGRQLVTSELPYTWAPLPDNTYPSHFKPI